MAANCVQDLEAAVKAVKDEYGNDPRWASVIREADKAVSDAKGLETSNENPSPGSKAADQVHEDVKAESASEDKTNNPEEKSEVKPESPADEKKESPAVEKAESPDEEKAEHPKDMSGAAKIALLMLRKK